MHVVITERVFFFPLAVGDIVSKLTNFVQSEASILQSCGVSKLSKSLFLPLPCCCGISFNPIITSVISPLYLTQLNTVSRI